MKSILWVGAVGLLALSCAPATLQPGYAACCEQCTCGCGQELCPRPRELMEVADEIADRIALGLIIGVGILAVAVMAYGAYLKVIAGILALLFLPYACAYSTTETKVPPILRWEAVVNLGAPCLYVSTAGVQQDAGTISLAIRAQNLQDVREITGGLVFSRTVLQYAGWYRGDWLDDPQCSIAYKEGIVTFEARGRTPRSGSGEVLVLMFRVMDDVRGESTRIQWYTPRVDGGTVAVLGGVVYVE